MQEDDVERFVTRLRAAMFAWESLPVPTIAAIDGAALGGGLELALACDLRYASENALLGLPETALAIIPGAGGSQRLPRIVGPAKAKELIFLAKRISGRESADIGLVTECVEEDKSPDSSGNRSDSTISSSTLDTALKVAKQIAQKGPIGILMAKKAINEGMQAPSMEAAMQVETLCYGQTVRTSDRVEGLRSFVEKRKPNYQGR
jgi:methylglutaconyl-CoA hydratase